MYRSIRVLFLAAIVICCLISLSTAASARPQKSLDDDNGKVETKKPEPKKTKGGKDLDEVPRNSGGKNLDEVPKSSGGKDLDSVGTKKTPSGGGKSLDSVEPTSAGKVKKPTHVETIRNDAPERAPVRRDPERRIEKRDPVPSQAIKPKEKEPVEVPNDVDTGPDYPEMVTIASGSFSMGSKDGGAYESPVHNVKLSGFELSKYEVTNHQFRLFVKATNYKTVAEREDAKITWRDYAIAGRARFPVVMVAWEDVQKYCEWLSTVNGVTYRLPSEAEWEYAARGGANDQPFPWGDKIEVAKANFASDESRNSYAEPVLDYLRAVGSYEPNSFGLYDVIGNVWEWSNDWFSDSYYRDSPAEDPKGPETGKSRVIRGGGWGHQARYCSVSFRKPCPPSYRSSSLGFRVAKGGSTAGVKNNAPAEKSDKPTEPVK